ncbi:EamA family transporter [Coraliomargarita sinensis]|uniref:EamA family transporter n=1 Tax=Coraliomargarita sinensis TaxID=2174842 RepID=A0A317ZJJ2_9BACT|nr:DMT family transporter [Coraliomargarita sinensis]PXA03939.1 EamA family transporter [Coraliomargarita sinensis]
MSPKSINLIQVKIAVLIWGGTAMFAKGIQLSVLDITCMRSLVAAAALIVFIRLRGRSAAVKSRKDFGLMLALGLFLCLHWLTYFQALKISTAAVAILSLHTYPVVTAMIEPLLFREKFKKADVLLAVAVFSGVVIMMPEINLSNTTTQGILLGIVSGLLFMSRNLMIRKMVQTYSSSTLMFWQTLVTGAVLAPFLFVFDGSSYTTESVILLLLLGTVFTAVPQTLFSSGLKNLSAKTVGILATLLPFYAATFGFLIHDERVTTRTVVGGVLILIGVVYETIKHSTDGPNAQKQTTPSA